MSLPQGRLRRRYSLARWQARPFRYEITVKREDEGRLSHQLAENARRGSWLNVAPPSGDFVLPGDSAMSRAVLIAGGVGITPLLAMIDQLSSQPAHPFQVVHLYWQVRSEDEWVYREELEGLARHDRRLSLHLLASRPRQGETHRISIEMLQDDLGGLAGTVYFLCAGPSLLDSMVSGLLETGIPREAVHFERFGMLSATGAIGEWHINVDGEAAVYSGHASLLDALEDGGLSIAADCRAGSCGECRLTVLSGEVRHLIAPEFALPPGQILPCCAVPGSDVRLTSRL